MNGLSEMIPVLAKALEAGGYGAAPSTMVQGSALQIEDLSPLMQNVCADEKAIKLQKTLSVESCKSTLVQFNRQLSYGELGGSAQLQGAVGMEETSEFVRVTVPMCFYAHVRRVTDAANMVATMDGVKAEERAAADGAKKLAFDIEFDSFRGKDDFSNAGVFDGNPLAIPDAPNMVGVQAQIRMSDFQANAKDLMFNEYGANHSVVISGGGVLSQANIEDASVRSAMNHGEADKLFVDPLVRSAYNKLTYGAGLGVSNIQRINLGSGGQDFSGADLRRQATSSGEVVIESSRFLSGKTTWARARRQAPAAVGTLTPAVGGAGTGSLAAAANYYYVATAVNEAGEGGPSAITASGNVLATGSVRIQAAAVSGAKWYNLYRASVNDPRMARFIGRVAANSTGALDFYDLGNAIPGFVTGVLLQADTLELKELCPFSRKKLAVTDLSSPEAVFRFVSLVAYRPRMNVLIGNLKGADAFYA